MRILELRMAHRLGAHVAFAELVARDRRPAAEVRVVQRQIHIRESRAAVQRSKSAAVVVVPPDSAVASAPPSPPRMEMVARSQRQPAD